MPWKELWAGPAESEIQRGHLQIFREERRGWFLAATAECLRRAHACDVAAWNELAWSGPTQPQRQAGYELTRKLGRGVELIIRHPPIRGLIEVVARRISMEDTRKMVPAEPPPGPPGSP